MADDDIRELERRFRASGAVDDEQAWLRARVRAGSLSRERVRLAASLGCPAAASALGEPVPPLRCGEVRERIASCADGATNPVHGFALEAQVRGLLALARRAWEDIAAQPLHSFLGHADEAAAVAEEGELVDPRPRLQGVVPDLLALAQRALTEPGARAEIAARWPVMRELQRATRSHAERGFVGLVGATLAWAEKLPGPVWVDDGLEENWGELLEKDLLQHVRDEAGQLVFVPYDRGRRGRFLAGTTSHVGLEESTAALRAALVPWLLSV